MARPQPLLTQPNAACWMAPADLHWHSKSVVAQLTPFAAEKMHDSAHLGTASALFWQGEPVGQAAGPVVTGALVMGPVEGVVVVVTGDGVVVVVTTAAEVVVVVTATGVVVVAGRLVQGVVGLAVTHSQREATEPKTATPVARPQPSVTQPSAAS